MRIYLLTQEDAFYLPRFFDKFLTELPRTYVVCGASVLTGEIAGRNVLKYIQLMRLYGTIKAALLMLYFKLMDLASFLFRSKRSFSVKGSFKKNGIPFTVGGFINTDDFISSIKSHNVELLVSVACPQIIQKKLREAVSLGAINIHGSLLPKYRGMLPSFWVLANGEQVTGVTVHWVNGRIDDGPIIEQKSIEILTRDTVHSLLLRSKIKYGPNLLIDALNSIKNGDNKNLPNDRREATYNSFPDKESINRFYQQNRRII